MSGQEDAVMPKWRRDLEALMLKDPMMQPYACIITYLQHKIFPLQDVPADLMEMILKRNNFIESRARGESVLDADIIRANVLSDMMKSNYEKDCSEMARKRRDYEENFPAAYAFIWASISAESQSTLEEQPEFEKIRESRDPLRLYKLAISSHVGDSAGRPKAEIKAEAIQVLATMKMRSTESVSVYKQRFLRQLEILEAVGCAKPDQELLAIQFRKSLDPSRFLTFEVDIQNQFSFTNQVPEWTLTVDGVALAASLYKTVRPKGRAHESETVFAISNAGSLPGQEKKKSKSPKPNKVKTPAAAASVGDTGLICHKCGAMGTKTPEGFFRCPNFKTSPLHARTSEKTYAIEAAFKDDLMATVMAIEEEELEYPWDVEEQILHESVLMVADSVVEHAGVYKSERGLYKTTDVLPDNEATTPIFGNRDLLTNIRPAPRRLYFSGIGGEEYSDDIGDFHPFGTVYYSPRVNVNCLSWSTMRDNPDLLLGYYFESDCFWVSAASEGHCKHIFHKTPKGLYAKSFEEQVNVTVTQKMAQYPVKDIVKAKAAREFERRLGVPAPLDVVKLLTFNAKGDVGFTPKHLNIAMDVFGPRIGALAGKSKEPENVACDYDPVPMHEIKDVQFLCDLMFAAKVCFLITLVKPLGIVFGNHVDSKHAASIARALTIQVDSVVKYGFNVSVVFFDGEGSMSTYNETISRVGVRVESSVRHVADVERVIQTIKSWARGIVREVDFKVGPLLMVPLITHVIKRMNLFPSKRGLVNISGMEALTQVKINLDLEVKHAFGDYCETTTPNLGVRKGDIQTSRTESCIALYNHERDGAIVCLNIDTRKLVIRYNLRILPTPQRIIDIMSKFDGDEALTMLGPPTAEEPLDDLYRMNNAKDASVAIPRTIVPAEVEIPNDLAEVEIPPSLTMLLLTSTCSQTTSSVRKLLLIMYLMMMLM
jgi:hypothetical protein